MLWYKSQLSQGRLRKRRALRVRYQNGPGESRSRGCHKSSFRDVCIHILQAQTSHPTVKSATMPVSVLQTDLACAGSGKAAYAAVGVSSQACARVRTSHRKQCTNIQHMNDVNTSPPQKKNRVSVKIDTHKTISILCADGIRLRLPVNHFEILDDVINIIIHLKNEYTLPSFTGTR